MEKDKKENERHRALRRKKKDRLTKLVFYTYVKRHHLSVVEEFERFYRGDSALAISTLSTSTPQNTPEISPAPDSFECEDNSAGV